jgi:hypothetical protein
MNFNDNDSKSKIPQQSLAMNYIKWKNYSTKPLSDWFDDKLPKTWYSLKQEGKNQLIKSILMVIKPDVIYTTNFEEEIQQFRKDLSEKLEIPALYEDDYNVDNDLLFRQKLCNKYGINLVIFNENEFNKISQIVPTYAEPRDMKRLTFFILRQAKTDYFSPILNEEITTDTSVIRYTEFPDLLKEIYDNEFPSEELEIPKNLMSLKIPELHELCRKMGLTVETVSEKSGKIIKKKKKELIEEINKYVKTE